LVKAVELANARGLVTVGLLGFDGGVLKSKVNECLWIPTEKGAYGLVESAHALLCHVLTDCLARDLVLDTKDEQETHAYEIANGATSDKPEFANGPRLRVQS
jgi:hypothetical protein